MLVDQETADRLKRERRQANRVQKVQEAAEQGEVVMTETKQKFKRGRVLPRREYKAKRRQERLAKYAPSLVEGDVEMEDRPKNVLPVSKTMRLVKDRASIRK